MVRAGESTPLKLFMSGIRAKATQDKYTRTLRQITCEFLEDWLEGTFEERVAQLVRYGQDKPDWTRDLLISLSRKLRERTTLDKNHKNYLNPTSFANYFKPIKKLFDMNDVYMPWKRIYATYPEQDNLPDTAGWTREEIAKMIRHTRNTQERALILVLASSGVRAGAIPPLNWGDLQPIHQTDDKLTLDHTAGDLACVAVHVYRGSSESYIAFITPEAFRALQEYAISWTKSMGKPANPKDPIFTATQILPRRASPRIITKRVWRIVQDAALHSNKEGKRHRVPLMNGFRRFFNKTCKSTISGDSALSSLIKKEYMMGHKGLTTLDENYFNTDTLELAAEYIRAVPELTIDDSDRLRRSNRTISDNIQRLEHEKDTKLERLTRDMADMARERDSMRQEIYELKRQRVPSVNDLLKALQTHPNSDGITQDVLEPLLALVRQLAAAQQKEL